MKMSPSLEKKYSKEQSRYLESMRLANMIAWAPVIFQVSRLMIKFGIFKMLADTKDGLSQEEIITRSGLSRYAVQVLLEASLTAETIIYRDDKYLITKAGWFLLSDPVSKVNLEFNHDVNYLGMYRMEEALLNGKPEGLKVFGSWSTIYEGLSSLPDNARRSWFAFDHYFSDSSFDDALAIVFANKPLRLLDVGGNTGRWALRCVAHNSEVAVTVMDLPQQLGLMEENI
ncbi:MAG: SAM-dependent methyltransferase, partial [Tannerella sp.]|nr:SAM-dependent methyltransferase [Tannerella sp.]